MPTNEERREVARKLREANVRREFYSPWCKMVESVLDGIDCGEDDGTCDENACCERFMKRMADLVDHQTQCPFYHYHGDRHYCSVHGYVRAIDRDALLALADEISRCRYLSARACEETHRGWADRIREALGGGVKFPAVTHSLPI